MCTFSFTIRVGSSGTIRFDRLEVPVSMSPALYDESGKIVYLNKDLEMVGNLFECFVKSRPGLKSIRLDSLRKVSHFRISVASAYKWSPLFGVGFGKMYEG